MSTLPTRQIGISELQALQRFAQQFVHLWDDVQCAPRKRKSRAQMNAAIALTLLRDVCKALGMLDTVLRIHSQRWDFGLSELLLDLGEAVRGMYGKLKWRSSIGVDVNKYKAFDMRNPSYKPPSAGEWKKAVRIAGVKLGAQLDTRSVSFKQEWISTVRKAAERLPKALPKAPPESTTPPAGATRLHFDPQTQAVTLDGKSHPIKNPRAFKLYRAIADCNGEPITRAKLRQPPHYFKGDKTVRKLLDTLPSVLGKTVLSHTSGYWLHLPAAKKIRT